MLDTKIVAPKQEEYYCYIYRYPQGYIAEDGTDLSGIVFYCGKGKLERINSHESEARTRNGFYCHCRKCKAIRRVWSQGLQVDKEKVYHTPLEDDAFLYEWACINMIYASSHLTNHNGNSFDYERRRELTKMYWKNWQKREKSPKQDGTHKQESEVQQQETLRKSSVNTDRTMYLTWEEAAILLRVSRNRAYLLAAKHQLTSYHQGKRTLLLRTDVENLVANRSK